MHESQSRLITAPPAGVATLPEQARQETDESLRAERRKSDWRGSRTQRENGLMITAESAGEPPGIRCDRDQVLRVFGNLIGNALKFTPRCGSIALHAEAEGGFVRFSVSNTGSGIPGEALGRVFERGFRGARVGPGLGLGLAIAKGLVEPLGGRVTVDRTPDKGSTFSLTLPVA
jgi:signal transduction histidine kinase